MNKINSLFNNVNLESRLKKDKTQKQTFGNSCVQNYAPAPVYTQVPYGINQRNYVKLGVDKLPNGSEVHVYRLSTGQNVQIIKKDGATSIMTKVNVGAFDEEGYPKGIAHFIEHSVFHGSKSYNADLMKQLDKITTYNNASTSSNETNYYMDLSSDSLEVLNQALDIQSDMLLNPTFCAIEKEKPIVRAEYQKDMLNDYNLMYENLLKILFQYSDTNEASISGNNETIDSITKEDMDKFHNNFYKPYNMTTMVTSKYNPDEIIGLVANNFVPKSLRDFNPILRYPIKTLDKTTRTDIITNNFSDGDVYLSFVCPSLANGFEKLKMQALCSLFCSRYIDSMNLSMQSSQVGLIYCNKYLNDDIKPNEAIQDIYQKIIDFKSKPPSKEEIKEIKEDLLKNLDSSFNSGNITVMETISEIMSDGNNYVTYEAYKEMINSLTPENIYEMVNHLDLNKAAIVVAHSKKSTSEEIKETDKKYPYQCMPIDIAGNSQKVNYSFNEHYSKLTGDKFYSTFLADGSRVFFVNSPDDNCEIEWKLTSEKNYSSNPASKYILYYLCAQKLLGSGEYPAQDEIRKYIGCESKDIDKEIAHMKSFSHVTLTQKNLEDAKKDALKKIDDMESSTYEQFCESIFGSKYTTTKEALKSQVEKLTLNDVVSDLNNMILNSQSTYVVKAPIAKNPNLLQEIANMLNCPNIQFKGLNQTEDSNNNLNVNLDFSDCVLYVDNVNQNKIAQAYNFAISKNPRDYYVFNLLVKILADKNHNTIREKLGLAYYSGASFEQKNNQGMIFMRTDASCEGKNDLEKIYKQYASNVNELRNGKISNDELLLAKNKIKGEMKSCFDAKNVDSLEVLHNFASNQHLIDSLGCADEIIDSITCDDIRNAANYVFKNKSQKILIAKQSLFDNNADYISTFGKTEKR